MGLRERLFGAGTKQPAQETFWKNKPEDDFDAEAIKDLCRELVNKENFQGTDYIKFISSMIYLTNGAGGNIVDYFQLDVGFFSFKDTNVTFIKGEIDSVTKGKMVIAKPNQSETVDIRVEKQSDGTEKGKSPTLTVELKPKSGLIFDSYVTGEEEPLVTGKSLELPPREITLSQVQICCNDVFSLYLISEDTAENKQIKSD